MSNLNTNEEELIMVENRYWVGLKEALERLEENADFKKVVLEAYFKDKAIDGVSLLAADHVVRNNLRGQVMEDLVAVSRLQDFFLTIKNLGTIPEDDDSEE